MADQSIDTPTSWWVTSGGDLVPAEPGGEQNMAAIGMRPATPEQTQDAMKAQAYQQKYGGWKGKLMAADYAIMSEATGGLAGQIAARVNPNYATDAKGFKDVNPGADALGHVAGVLGGALVPGSVPSLAMKAGLATEAATKGVMGVASQIANPSVVEALKLAVSKGAGYAIQGAILSGSQAVSENALGDTNLVSQATAMHIAKSAGLAGLLGAAGSGIYNVAKSALPEASTGQFQSWLQKMEGEQNLKAAANGTGPGKHAAKLFEANTTYAMGDPEEAASLAREARRMGIKGSATTMAQKASEMKQDLDGLLTNVAEKVDNAVEPTSRIQTPDFFSRVRSQILEPMIENPDPPMRAKAMSFKKYLANSEARMGETMGVSDLLDMHQYALDALPVNKLIQGNPKLEGLNSLLGLIGQDMDGLIAQSGTGVTPEWSKLLRQYEAADRIEQVAKAGASGSSFGKQAAGVAGAALGGAGGVAHGLGGMAEGVASEGLHAAGLGHLGVLGSVLGAAGGALAAGPLKNRVGSEVAGVLGDTLAGGSGMALQGLQEAAAGLDGLVAGAAAAHTEKTLRMAGQEGALGDVVNETGSRIQKERRVNALDPNITSLTEQGAYRVLDFPERAGILAELERLSKDALDQVEQSGRLLITGQTLPASKGTGPDFKASKATQQRRFTGRVGLIQRAMTDPEEMQRVLVAHTDGWFDAAPQTATALQSHIIRAVGFLASKIPSRDPSGPLAPPPQPNTYAVQRFNRYWEAVEDPVSVLKQARAHALSTEAVEAVQTVYPHMWAEFQQSVLTAAASSARLIPYQRRLQIDKIMNGSMDGSTRPAPLMSNQGVYAAQAQQEQQQPSPNPGTSKLTLGQRSRPATTSAAEADDDERNA